MKNRYLYFILMALTMASVSPTSAWAQASSSKSDYTLNKLYWLAPSATLANPAFLPQVTQALNPVKAFTDAALNGSYEMGPLRNTFDPETRFDKGLNIRSHSALGNVSLYGRFAYDHTNLGGSQWRGLYNPYSTPFMMTDSIPGNATLELYQMEMGLSVPLGRNWSLGAAVRYHAGVMAKHKDLRNRNVLMQFDIRPGLAYHGAHLSVGLDVRYIRSTEKIEYMQVDASTEKYLFDIYGLWVFNSQGYSSAETSRLKETQAYGAAAQVTWRAGAMASHNRFEALYSLDEQGETGYNNLRQGDAKQLTYTYEGILTWGLQHRLAGSFRKSDLLGYRYLQQQELDSASNIRRWVTYDVMNTYKGARSDWNAAYTFRKARSAWDIAWEATAGISGTAWDRETVEYPQRFHQRIAYWEAYALYTQHVPMGRKGLLSLTPSLAYRKGNGIPLETVLEDNSQTISTGEGAWMLMDPLQQEYAYWTQARLTAGLRVRYAYALPKGGVGLYADAGYRVAFSTRHTMQLAIGITF